jgi:hypothetical protein
VKRITLEVNEEWFRIMDILTRWQEGAVWVSVEEVEENETI